MQAPTLARADLRREYGITRDDLEALDAQDFIELLSGLSAKCRFYAYLSEHASPATSQDMGAPLTADQYLAGLSRHRGQIVRVRGAS